MNTFKFSYLGNYKNHGQDAEQSVRYALTGRIYPADNIKHSRRADCLHYQIKSARATICTGLDLAGYLAEDAATEFIYADKHGTAWVLNRLQYMALCERFYTVTTDTDGNPKMRFKDEPAAMMRFLRSL